MSTCLSSCCTENSKSKATARKSCAEKQQCLLRISDDVWSEIVPVHEKSAWVLGAAEAEGTDHTPATGLWWHFRKYAWNLCHIGLSSHIYVHCIAKLIFVQSEMPRLLGFSCHSQLVPVPEGWTIVMMKEKCKPLTDWFSHKQLLQRVTFLLVLYLDCGLALSQVSL